MPESVDEQGSQAASDPSWAKDYTNTKDVPFWIPNIDDKINPDICNLLENYSKISPADIKKHIYDAREKAWAIRSYPCTGSALFLRPLLPLSPAYLSILRRMKEKGTKLIDIGCFIGQDLRQLVFDGCPPENLMGCDIVSHWDVGLDFFCDRDTAFERNVAFFEGDIFHLDSENSKETVKGNRASTLSSLKGELDVISITNVVHQWDWDGQVHVCKNLVKLSRGPGSLVVGFQVGSAGPTRIGPHSKENSLGTKEVWWHNPATWQEMWELVGKETMTKWEAQASLKTWEDMGWKGSDQWYMGDCARIIQFVVKRLV